MICQLCNEIVRVADPLTPSVSLDAVQQVQFRAHGEALCQHLRARHPQQFAVVYGLTTMFAHYLALGHGAAASIELPALREAMAANLQAMLTVAADVEVTCE